MTLRLHYNENTAGCSETVVRALAALTPHDIATYRDDAQTVTDIAGWFGVPPASVLPVNGLDEGIQLAAQLAALESPARYRAIVAEPAFEMYAAVVTATGGQIVALPPSDGFAFDADRLLAAADDCTRMVFLCDPNNPTGVGIARQDIERVADGLPRALIFVDEAYADFSGRTMIGEGLALRPNVIVGRTFAKAHGLAGLRIGALIAAETTIARLRRCALPYRINVAAATALRAALGDRAHFARALADAGVSRELLTEACARLGFATWRSEANFQLVRIGRATQFAEWMDARGVRVRDRSSLAGCSGCVRITAGPVAHTQRAISLMEEWHASQCR